MSFCVLTHPIGQNGRAVRKKHDGHGNVGKVGNFGAVGNVSNKGYCW